MPLLLFYDAHVFDTLCLRRCYVFRQRVAEMLLFAIFRLYALRH